MPLALIDTEQGAMITAATADLRQYISTHPDKVFGDYEHLKRKPPQPQAN